MKFSNEGGNETTLFRLLLAILLAIMAAGLGLLLVALPSQAPGLGEHVLENLGLSGVSNPVTAVLLNFRGYDTLLEMGVVLLALLGVWSLGGVPEWYQSPVGLILDTLPRLLVPVLVLVAGYLLWVGAHAPGGAFQAGSVLGAAGVLLLLAGWRPAAVFDRLALRLALTMGLLVFVLIGIMLVLMGRQFLDYPPQFASGLILLIETAATLSIGITLAALFLGGRPEGRHNDE